MSRSAPAPARAPYYIQAPPPLAAPTSAGIRVLYYLCDRLNRAGEEAWIASEPYQPAQYRAPEGLIAPLLTAGAVQAHRRQGRPPIAVYPEVVVGNPLNASAVVRYVMNEPGLLGGPVSFAGELAFGYGQILADQLGCPDRNLFLPALDPEDFSPGPPGPRDAVLFYAPKFRKVHNGEPFRLPPRAVEITREVKGAPDGAAVKRWLREADRLYLYENSALAIEAPLSGCVAIMMPNPFMSYPIGARDHGMGGIAWGDDPAEVARARGSIAELRQSYEEAIARFPAQLESFIHQTQAFGARPRRFAVHGRRFRVPRAASYVGQASAAAQRMLHAGKRAALPAKAWTVLRKRGLVTTLTIAMRLALSIVGERLQALVAIRRR